MATTNSPLIVIVGETGSGKSALGLKLAKKYNGEIICADSRTVYKGLDIGTAKPTKAEQALVRHHLLDVVEPDETFTAFDFQKLANKAIADISARGNLPIMVGGTGLYIDGVIFEFDFAEPNPSLRQKLSAYNDEKLVKLVLKAGGQHINTKNHRHMMRFLETSGAPKHKSTLRPNTLVIGLLRDKEELQKRINRRVDGMFKAGLEEEARKLANKYGWEHESMSGVVYKLLRKYFAGEISLDEVKRLFVVRDMQYAKRQRTWFRRNKFVRWSDDDKKALIEVNKFLKNNNYNEKV